MKSPTASAPRAMNNASKMPTKTPWSPQRPRARGGSGSRASRAGLRPAAVKHRRDQPDRDQRQQQCIKLPLKAVGLVLGRIGLRAAIFGGFWFCSAIFLPPEAKTGTATQSRLDPVIPRVGQTACNDVPAKNNVRYRAILAWRWCSAFVDRAHRLVAPFQAKRAPAPQMTRGDLGDGDADQDDVAEELGHDGASARRKWRRRSAAARR